jgi:nuclear protein localization family protein 4
MNFKEMSSFVGYWQQSGCMEQRMGWLYGYYSEDPNYPEGVRVNVEAIYEPN